MRLRLLISISIILVSLGCEQTFKEEDNSGNDLFSKIIRSWYTEHPEMQKKESIEFHLTTPDMKVIKAYSSDSGELIKVGFIKKGVEQLPPEPSVEKLLAYKNQQITKGTLIKASPEKLYGLEHYDSKIIKEDSASTFIYMPENIRESKIKAVIYISCSDPILERWQDNSRECRMRILNIPRLGNFTITVLFYEPALPFWKEIYHKINEVIKEHGGLSHG